MNTPTCTDCAHAPIPTITPAEWRSAGVWGLEPTHYCTPHARHHVGTGIPLHVALIRIDTRENQK